MVGQRGGKDPRLRAGVSGCRVSGHAWTGQERGPRRGGSRLQGETGSGLGGPLMSGEVTTYDTVRYEKEDGIGILTFNRPEVMNAHNYHMKVEEQAVAESVLLDDGVRVLIVTGAGRGFHTGEDVKDVFMGQDFDKLKADRLRSWTGRLDPNSWTGQVSPRYFYGYA